MAFLAGLPKPPSSPSGRYTRTNPLRREWGLRLLTENLPEPLRWAVIRAWHRPGSYSNATYKPELPSPHRQRPDKASLPNRPPRIVAYLALVELELSRRLVEAPQANILPVTRNAMLAEQSMYLRWFYDALALQIGATNALAEFQWLLTAVA